MHQLPLFLSLYLLPLFSATIPTVKAYKWPNPQYDTLETLLFEGRRTDGSSLSSNVHPCRPRTGTGASVPAEWLRFAFHDMATHNIDDGTGGMDGSIVYELDRAENLGLGFIQTLNDFEHFPSKLISRSDIIAIGTIMSVATCGGPLIPFHPGRVDVWTGGGLGTPEPQHDLPTLTESFRKQGFNQAEMIKLVACGHTMGSVRSEVFPQLVPPNPNSVNPVLVDFDKTKSFDNAVVTEYLDNTSQNVLVTTPNETLASDLRVFNSDGNSTMRALADANTFSEECKVILTRMIDTVPKEVKLQPELTLLNAKVNLAQLTFENKTLVLKTIFRLSKPIDAADNKDRVVTMFWCDRYGTNKDCAESARSTPVVARVLEDPNFSPMSLRQGLTFYMYTFIAPIDSAQSVSKFWFEVDEKDGSKVKVYNNPETSTGDDGSGSGEGYVIDQDEVLFIPMMSKQELVPSGTLDKSLANRNGIEESRLYTLVVGVREGVNPSRVYVETTDVSIRNFSFPMGATVDLAANEATFPTLQGYQFYSGQWESLGVYMTLDVHAVKAGGESVSQVYQNGLVLDNTPLLAPGNVTLVKGKANTGAALTDRNLEFRMVVGMVAGALGVWIWDSLCGL